MSRFFDAGFAELQAIKSSRLKVQEFASFQSASKFVFENLQKISQVDRGSPPEQRRRLSSVLAVLDRGHTCTAQYVQLYSV